LKIYFKKYLELGFLFVLKDENRIYKSTTNKPTIKNEDHTYSFLLKEEIKKVDELTKKIKALQEEVEILRMYKRLYEKNKNRLNEGF